MRTFTAVVERDPQTKLFVGYVPGFAGAHSQGATMDELQANLREVVRASEAMGFVEVRQRGRTNNFDRPTAAARLFRFMPIAISRRFY